MRSSKFKWVAALVFFYGASTLAEAPEFSYKNGDKAVDPSAQEVAPSGLNEGVRQPDSQPATIEHSSEVVGRGNEQLLRAQIKAKQSTMISSEMSGRISLLKIKDGERFSAGQVLVGFHCSMENAELSKSKATLEKKRKTYEVNQKLSKLNSISTLELAVSKTEEDEAKADVRVAEAVVERCIIKAPFSGKVVEVTARAFQTVKEGEALLEIVNDKDLEIEFIAPSKALPNIKPGKTFKVTIDETRLSYLAEIIRLGGRVDPVSQTIKVYGRINSDSSDLLPGMSGSIALDPSE